MTGGHYAQCTASRARSIHQVVDVAPAPGFAGLVRAHDRMPGVAVVVGGVLMRAGIAASDVAAGQAHAQVRPVILAQLGALLADAGRKRRRVRFGRIG